MQLTAFALLALTFSAGAVPVLDSQDDDPGPSITLPGEPTIPMPPGADVLGPDGPIPGFPNLAPPQTPEAATPTSPAPAPKLSPEAHRKARIDDLFGRLAAAADETEAAALLGSLERLWLQSGSDTADLLMSRALGALESKDYGIALQLLDKVVALQPDWAEAWNQRATVHYLDNDDVESMADIGHVLRLEPRHFGALSGMGYILHRNGDDKAALTMLRKAASINPKNKDLNALIDELAPEVEGRDI